MAQGLTDMVRQLNDSNPDQIRYEVDVPRPTVFEVPAHLRENYPANFQNRGLEFGLHRRTLTWLPSEVFKYDIAQVVHIKLARWNRKWGDFARDVVGDVDRARRVYSGTSASRYSDEDVYNLLALDAVLLVGIFKLAAGGKLFFNEFESMRGRLREIVSPIDKRDFFLIDNQVPMYMLQSAIRQMRLIDEETLEKQKTDPEFKLEELVEDELDLVLHEAVALLHPFTFSEPRNSQCCCKGSAQSGSDLLRQHLINTYPVVPIEKSLMNCQHLLDCLYTVICGHSVPLKADQGWVYKPPLESIPSASRLEAVGIQSVGTVSTLRDVRLSGKGYLERAKLQLPKVALYDFSESAFHNLAVHEQLMSGGQRGDLRCYLQCMASLSVDIRDLQMLKEEGVINDHTGSAAILGMWDRTLKGLPTPFPSETWVSCYRKIHEHRKSRLKRWRCECWGLFFAKPWTLMSVIAAIILLILTATQTWYTVHPPNH